MALFDWLSQKKDPAGPPSGSSLGRDTKPSQLDPTLPEALSSRRRTDNSPQALNRRSERLERRELLYTVIRESMVRAGVLSASYKFKVLSLDQRGRQYVVMMDLASEFGGHPERLSETEAQIAQTAKARHDILVTSVYWRFTDQVALGLTPTLPQRRPSQEASAAPAGAPGAQMALASHVLAPSQASSPASTALPVDVKAASAIEPAANGDDPHEFQNTLMEDLHGPDGPPSELGATQPGELR